MRVFKYVLLSLVLLLIVFRVCLPYVLLHYVEKQINKLPQYKAKIHDLDVNLYRGSYVIKKFQLWKTNNNIPVPFLKADRIDISIEWKALLHRHFVGKINVVHPEINFVDDPRGKNAQLTIDQQWVQIVKSLFPLNINAVTITDGAIHLRSYSGKPPFDIYLKNVELQMTNMQNAKNDAEGLLSTLNFSANAMNGGVVSAKGSFDPFAKTPTFKFNLELKSLNVVDLKLFLQHYTNVDVEKGKFSLYIEAAAAKGKITGYAKPFMKDLKIGTKSNNLVEALYQGTVAVVAKVLENPKKDTIATKINLSGKIDDPDMSVVSIIGYLLRHAFIQALVPQIDHEVRMNDVVYH